MSQDSVIRQTRAKPVTPFMTLTLKTILSAYGMDPANVLAIRHVYTGYRDDSDMPGINSESTDADILEYTGRQSARPRVFPSAPPKVWVVFVRDGGDRARLWSVLENRGERSHDGMHRWFDLVDNHSMADLRNRLVIGWRSPRTWWLKGNTASRYPVMEIADAEPVPFPGFDRLVLTYSQLQAAMNENRYAAWRVALSSVIGIYLITDSRDGRHYIGKADGQENIRQRWSSYAANGHGGNAELKNLNPETFRFSLLRIFDPGAASHEINAAEAHFKTALDSRNHGLNRN